MAQKIKLQFYCACNKMKFLYKFVHRQYNYSEIYEHLLLIIMHRTYVFYDMFLINSHGIL
jgi:hypothetical protein